MTDSDQPIYHNLDAFFISLQRTGRTQISPFITTLMLSLFLSNVQDGLSTIPEFLCSASFCFSPTHRTDCRRGGCMVGTRCVGVSRWSYLAPEASDGKVLCGHKPQSKPHLSEPGTHQRTWRVMGRPARQKTQTLSMPRRNDRTRHDHAAAPPAVRPSLPPSHPQKKSPKKGPKTRSAPVVAYRGDYYEKNCMCNDTDTHHYSVFRNVLSNYPYTTRQI